MAGGGGQGRRCLKMRGVAFCPMSTAPRSGNCCRQQGTRTYDVCARERAGCVQVLVPEAMSQRWGNLGSAGAGGGMRASQRLRYLQVRALLPQGWLLQSRAHVVPAPHSARLRLARQLPRWRAQQAQHAGRWPQACACSLDSRRGAGHSGRSTQGAGLKRARAPSTAAAVSGTAGAARSALASYMRVLPRCACLRRARMASAAPLRSPAPVPCSVAAAAVAPPRRPSTPTCSSTPPPPQPQPALPPRLRSKRRSSSSSTRRRRRLGPVSQPARPRSSSSSSRGTAPRCPARARTCRQRRRRQWRPAWRRARRRRHLAGQVWAPHSNRLVAQQRRRRVVPTW